MKCIWAKRLRLMKLMASYRHKRKEEGSAQALPFFVEQEIARIVVVHLQELRLQFLECKARFALFCSSLHHEMTVLNCKIVSEL